MTPILNNNGPKAEDSQTYGLGLYPVRRVKKSPDQSWGKTSPEPIRASLRILKSALQGC